MPWLDEASDTAIFSSELPRSKVNSAPINETHSPDFKIMFGSVAFWLVIERRDKLLRLFMADWHVSGSESEEEGVGDDGMEVGNLRIPAHRVAELLRTIETRKTLDLECLAGSSGKTTARRRRRKRHKRKGGSPSAADDSRTQEEVSETASEQRSSASTDTRDGKR